MDGCCRRRVCVGVFVRVGGSGGGGCTRTTRSSEQQIIQQMGKIHEGAFSGKGGVGGGRESIQWMSVVGGGCVTVGACECV